MNRLLEALQRKNPGLGILPVTDKEFAHYGRVLEGLATESLAHVLGETQRPEQGNCYVASDPALEALAVMADIRRMAFGGMELQAGYCNGHGHKLNALEYHKCGEVNFTTTGLMLLLARPEQLEQGHIKSQGVAAFYLPPNILVELHPRVLHFAPCRVRPEGFDCLVALERGVNAPLDWTNPRGEGEDKLLWMKGKWLIAHPDSPQAAKGAYVGISGENLSLAI